MIIIKTITLAALIMLACLLPLNTFGQDDDRLTKEVQVVRPYEPTISDAFKINQMPQVEDTISIIPSFSYNITLRPIATKLPVNPIPPARMVSEPLVKLYQGYTLLGMDMHGSPSAQVYYGSQRSTDLSWGGWLKHHSSFQRANLDNDERVNASFSRTSINASGKSIFDNSALSADAGFSHFSYRFYGFDTTSTNPTSPDDAAKQYQQNAHVNLAFHSTHSDSTHLNYSISSGFNSFNDRYSMEQNTFRIKTELNKFLESERIGGTTEMTHHMMNPNLNPNNATILRVAPWAGLFGDQWRATAGINYTYENTNGEGSSHFYPIADLSYDIVSNYVIPYFGFGGYLEDNSYANIIEENPWVEPGLNVTNTSHKFLIRGGVKGNFSPKAAYNLTASFSLIDSLYFYVNPTINETPDVLANTFIVVYDDNVQRKNFKGELTIAPINSFNIFLSAEYNNYSLQDIDYPWHRPELSGRFAISYGFREKIFTTATVHFEGKRYARAADGQPIELDGIIDANLNFEYRYNRRLSAYLNLNNLTGQHQHLYNLYPMLGFNTKFGLTYAF